MVPGSNPGYALPELVWRCRGEFSPDTPVLPEVRKLLGVTDGERIEESVRGRGLNIRENSL